MKMNVMYSLKFVIVVIVFLFVSLSFVCGVLYGWKDVYIIYYGLFNGGGMQGGCVLKYICFWVLIFDCGIEFFFVLGWSGL